MHRGKSLRCPSWVTVNSQWLGSAFLTAILCRVLSMRTRIWSFPFSMGSSCLADRWWPFCSRLTRCVWISTRRSLTMRWCVRTKSCGAMGRLPMATYRTLRILPRSRRMRSLIRLPLLRCSGPTKLWQTRRLLRASVCSVCSMRLGFSVLTSRRTLPIRSATDC